MQLSDQVIYLNHAGVGPWPKIAAEAAANFAQENASYGAKNYLRWLSREKELRANLGQLIGLNNGDDIALLKNTSEAISIVAFGIRWQPGDVIVTTNQEFPSNRIPWEAAAKRFDLKLVSVDISDADPEQALIDALQSTQVRILAVSSIQYATGLRLDLERLGDACRKLNVLFCVDAIQSVGAVKFDVLSYQADFVMADGHKWMLGPEGVALFYCKPERLIELNLYQYGWHMVEEAGNFDRHDWEISRTAKRFEAGSPNLLGAHTLAASTDYLLEFGMTEIEERVLANAQHVIEEVKARPSLQLLSNEHPNRHGGIVTFKHADILADKLYAHLMAHQVICAKRLGGIRFSPHFHNTAEQIRSAFEILDEVPA